MSYLLIGIQGHALTDEERAWVAMDAVAGVILFSRNWQSPLQVRALTDAIREIDPAAIIAVDQEGGRVQRFCEPCSTLPPLGVIGDMYERDPEEALEAAFAHAQLMATEMLALGVDISFAPVLDVDGDSQVIGDRAFHRSPDVVKELGRIYVKGMHNAGMKACGKHFPGHGSVLPDTHMSVAEDDRSLDEIARHDLKPFQVAILNGLDAVMMAHVRYPAVDQRAAGYSSHWIGEVLRGRMRFNGVVISDDLGMVGAFEAGDYRDRLAAALDAGCDMALVCKPEDMRELLACGSLPSVSMDRRDDLRGQLKSWPEVEVSDERVAWQECLQDLAPKDQNTI